MNIRPRVTEAMRGGEEGNLTSIMVGGDLELLLSTSSPTPSKMQIHSAFCLGVDGKTWDISNLLLSSHNYHHNDDDQTSKSLSGFRSSSKQKRMKDDALFKAALYPDAKTLDSECAPIEVNTIFAQSWCHRVRGQSELAKAIGTTGSTPPPPPCQPEQPLPTNQQPAQQIQTSRNRWQQALDRSGRHSNDGQRSEAINADSSHSLAPALSTAPGPLDAASSHSTTSNTFSLRAQSFMFVSEPQAPAMSTSSYTTTSTTSTINELPVRSEPPATTIDATNNDDKDIDPSPGPSSDSESVGPLMVESDDESTSGSGGRGDGSTTTTTTTSAPSFAWSSGTGSIPSGSSTLRERRPRTRRARRQGVAMPGSTGHSGGSGDDASFQDSFCTLVNGGSNHGAGAGGTSTVSLRNLPPQVAHPARTTTMAAESMVNPWELLYRPRNTSRWSASSTQPTSSPHRGGDGGGGGGGGGMRVVSLVNALPETHATLSPTTPTAATSIRSGASMVMPPSFSTPVPHSSKITSPNALRLAPSSPFSSSSHRADSDCAVPMTTRTTASNQLEEMLTAQQLSGCSTSTLSSNNTSSRNFRNAPATARQLSTALTTDTVLSPNIYPQSPSATLTTTTTAAPPLPPAGGNGTPKVLRMEITPGQFLPVRGADETELAILNGAMRQTSCSCCTSNIFCIQMSEFVVCPVCHVVSPMTDGMGGTNVGKSGRYGVGLGLTPEDLEEMKISLASRTMTTTRR
jgi:hypothetical protein